MGYYIYKYVYKNEIVYIGQTVDLKRRIKQHEKEVSFLNYNNSDIYYFPCYSKTEMDSFEYFLIQKYHPVLNVVHNNDGHNKIITFEEPAWTLYQEEAVLKIRKDEKKTNNITTKRIRESGNLDFLINNIQENKKSFNNFNSVFHNFSLFEQKILLFMCLQEKLKQISYTDSNIPFSVKNYTTYTNSTSENWYNYIKNNCSLISFDNETKKYFFNFPKNIESSPLTSLSLEDINNFNKINSKYTIPVFEIIITFLNQKLDKKELVTYLCDKCLNNFKDFRRRCLEPCLNNLKDINKEYDYTYDTEYSGRSVKYITFKNNKAG